jgi:PTH1 family peptidyl-tRNA hydrolase
MFFAKRSKFSSTYDYIVVGLGNPGKEYEKTRHNIGFRAIDLLCENLGVECKKSKFKSLIGEGKIAQSRVLIMKPQTFMNLSGQAVLEAMSFYKLTPEKVIVIFDDITLDVGRLRIRAKGSDGGHRGMRNIIELSGSDAFPRIKLGVGQKPHPDYDTKDWVLSKFSSEDEKILSDSTKNAAEAVKCIITKDISTAMNRFNK